MNNIYQSSKAPAPLGFKTILILFFVVLLVLYLSYRVLIYYNSRRVVYAQEVELVKQKRSGTSYVVVDNKKLPLPVQANEYTISFWIFIKDYSYRYNAQKTVMLKGTRDRSEVNPEIYLEAKDNKMVFRFELQTNSSADARDLETIKSALKITPSPVEDEEPDLEEPSGSGENKKESFANLLKEFYGHKHSKKSNITEGFEDVEPTEIPQELSISDVDERLDTVELQVKKLLEEEEESKTQTVKTDVDGVEVEKEIPVKESKSEMVYDSCFIKHVPLQKWNHVVVSVYQQGIDIYLNGEMHRSCFLKGIPKINGGHLHLSPDGGFSGYISNVKYTNQFITQERVQDLYVEGPKSVPTLGEKIKSTVSNVSTYMLE